MTRDEIKYLWNYVAQLEAELSRYRVLPAVPIRDWFMGCALAGFASVIRDPAAAVLLAAKCADAAIDLRAAETAAAPTAKEGITK